MVLYNLRRRHRPCLLLATLLVNGARQLHHQSVAMVDLVHPPALGRSGTALQRATSTRYSRSKSACSRHMCQCREQPSDGGAAQCYARAGHSFISRCGDALISLPCTWFVPAGRYGHSRFRQPPSVAVPRRMADRRKPSSGPSPVRQLQLRYHITDPSTCTTGQHTRSGGDPLSALAPEYRPVYLILTSGGPGSTAHAIPGVPLPNVLEKRLEG